MCPASPAPHPPPRAVPPFSARSVAVNGAAVCLERLVLCFVRPPAPPIALCASPLRVPPARAPPVAPCASPPRVPLVRAPPLQIVPRFAFPALVAAVKCPYTGAQEIFFEKLSEKQAKTIEKSARIRYNNIAFERGCSSPGRAIRSQRIGSQFESDHLHQQKETGIGLSLFAGGGAGENCRAGNDGMIAAERAAVRTRAKRRVWPRFARPALIIIKQGATALCAAGPDHHKTGGDRALRGRPRSS